MISSPTLISWGEPELSSRWSLAWGPHVLSRVFTPFQFPSIWCLTLTQKEQKNHEDGIGNGLVQEFMALKQISEAKLKQNLNSLTSNPTILEAPDEGFFSYFTKKDKWLWMKYFSILLCKTYLHECTTVITAHMYKNKSINREDELTPANRPMTPTWYPRW